MVAARCSWNVLKQEFLNNLARENAPLKTTLITSIDIVILLKLHFFLAVIFRD